MRKKSFLIIVLFLIIVIGFIILLIDFEQESGYEPQYNAYKPLYTTSHFIIYNSKNIEFINLNNIYGNFQFQKGDEGWSSLQNISLNRHFLNFLNSVENNGISANFIAIDYNLEQFGLQNPKITAEFYIDNSPERLYIGYQAIDGSFYAKNANYNRIYTISPFFAHWLGSSVDNIVNRDIYQFNLAFIIYIQLFRENAEPMIITPNYAMRNWENAEVELAFHTAFSSGLFMLEPIAGHDINIDHAFEFIYKIQNINFGNIASKSIYNLQYFGLDRPIIDISIDYFDPDNGIYNHTLMPVSVSRFRIGDISDNYYYILYSGIDHIFKVNREIIDDIFSISPFDLIDRFVHNVPINFVNSIEILYKNERYFIELEIDNQNASISINNYNISTYYEFEEFAFFYINLSQKYFEHILPPFVPEDEAELIIIWNLNPIISFYYKIETRFYNFDPMFYTIMQSKIDSNGENNDEYAQFLINRTIINKILEYLRNFYL